MGMFDRVWVACPDCGHRNEHQTKAGECSLADYEVYNAPPEVAAAVAGPAACEECGQPYEVVAHVLVGVHRRTET